MTSFGVFEPMRGRIVYVVGDELRAIDPAVPSSVHSMVLPDELDTSFAAAGWSADGTRLALASEHSGRAFLVDADGTITPTRKELGCCAFVTDPWLAPDGTTALGLVTAGGVQLVDLEGGDASRVSNSIRRSKVWSRRTRPRTPGRPMVAVSRSL